MKARHQTLLLQFDIPSLILRGDDDQIVPYSDTSLLQAKLIKNSTLKVYKGASHGMCTVNKDLLAFIKG